MLQDLFRKVLPQQCLGSVWSRRSSGSSRQNGRAGQSSTGGCSDETVASVSATVDQFNAVTHRVIASVVGDTPPSSSSVTSATASSLTSQRARVIEKWIDIAQVRTPRPSSARLSVTRPYPRGYKRDLHPIKLPSLDLTTCRRRY